MYSTKIAVNIFQPRTEMGICSYAHASSFAYSRDWIVGDLVKNSANYGVNIVSKLGFSPQR